MLFKINIPYVFLIKQLSLIMGMILALSNICISQPGKLPANPYEGMQMTYEIRGALISKEMNKPGINKWQRNLVLTGLSADSLLGVSGYLYSGLAHSTVTITVGAGRESVTKEYELKEDSGLNFRQMITIPADARSANIYINMCVLISPRQEARELILFGVWDGKWKNVSFK